jgi:hypothetical protein
LFVLYGGVSQEKSGYAGEVASNGHLNFGLGLDYHRPIQALCCKLACVSAATLGLFFSAQMTIISHMGELFYFCCNLCLNNQHPKTAAAQTDKKTN